MNDMNSGDEDAVPYHLMPVAAMLGTYAIAASLHALYLISQALSSPPSPSAPPQSVLRPHAPSTANSPSSISKIAPLATSRSFLLLLASIGVSAVLFGLTTAHVNNALPSFSEPFDPYAILDLEYGVSDVAAIKAAYRTQAKIHHPDKHSGQSQNRFEQVHTAYQALTDADAKRNWELHGHPDGMPVRPLLDFALPGWLLRPEGNVALVLVAFYLAFFAGLVFVVRRGLSPAADGADGSARAVPTSAEAGPPGPRKNLNDNTVAGDDITYLSQRLRPDSTPLHILTYLATTPESLKLTCEHLKIADGFKERRIAYHNKEQQTQQQQSTLDAQDAKKAEDEAAAQKLKEDEDTFGLDSGGWADSDDDDDDEDAQAAKKALQEKELLAKQVAEASGRSTVKKQTEEDMVARMRIEGVDDGVLGQGWVEATLEGIGQWPPGIFKKDVSEGGLEGMMVDLVGGDGEKVGVLEHREARRNLCMILGRLNAQTLNLHPELVSAGQKELIDLTYFKATMEFRQRTGLLLEAALRVAAMTRSYRLYRTVVETAAMFKIGATSATNKKTIRWFQMAMTKTYGGEDGIPKVELTDKTLRRMIEGENEGGGDGNKDVKEEKEEIEIRGGDPLVLDMQVDRLHAEKFLKHKMALAMKQGVDPKMVLATGAYRELWWILVRAKRISADDGDEAEDNVINKNAGPEEKKFLNSLNEETTKIFTAEQEEDRLLTAWPLVVQSIAQKKGNVKVRFPAPLRPGKYKFLIDVKSQEFFGCDQSFTIEKEVVERKEEEKET